MAEHRQSPFVPGLDVMIAPRSHYHGSRFFRQDRVLKVHKTGHFTLESSPTQRWRPTYGGNDYDKDGWSAYATGSSSGPYQAIRCVPSTEAVEAARVLALQESALRKRWYAIESRISGMRHSLPPASFIDAVEAALATLDDPASTPSRAEGA